MSNLHKALDKLRKAVEDEGPRPDVHRAVMRETERRWPSLMKAVRAVLTAQEEEQG